VPQARKPVTVVFCDLTGSTELSTRLDAEALREVTLRYFDVMRERLERHGGTVEKFIGDAVMAVFGVPVLHEDDARRAVRAALEMLTALDHLNEELERDHGVRLAVRIGINTGEAVATGDPFARQALVSGEVVNVAARLEQNAGSGEILIGTQTYLAVEPLVVAEDVGPLRLKGVAGEVTGRRVLDLRDDDPAVLRRFDSPFVGRTAELRALRAAAERAASARQARLLALLGDAGTGKTRLARHWLAQASALGVLVGSGRCRPYGEGGSLLALADAVRPLADAVDAADAADPRTGEALAVLRAGLLLDGTPSPSVEETGWAVARLLEAAGRERPLALLLDDCHWGSAVLLDTLDRVAAQVRDTAAVFVCTARPEVLDRHPGWGSGSAHSAVLPVPPLAPAEARTLAGHLLEVVPQSADALGALLDRAEGNPLYLEQLLSLVTESPAPSGPGPQPAAHALPLTLHALLAARVDALAGGEREVLDMAAVAGRDFTVDEVHALRAGPAGDASYAEVERRVHSLVRRRLVEPSRAGFRPAGEGGPGAAYRFASGLIRDVTYEAMAKRTRAERHERLAAHLDGRGAGDERVGSHLAHAYRLLAELGPRGADALQLRERAARRLGAAGARAADRCDLPRAGDLLDGAVALYGPGPWESPAVLPLARRLGEVRFALGRPAEGRAVLDRVRESAAVAADPLTYAHVQLYLACMAPDVDASVAVARRVAPVFARHRDRLGLARVGVRLGQYAQVRGGFAASRQHLEQALAHAAAAGAGPECATAVGALAVGLWMGPVPAPEAIRRCLLLPDRAPGRRAVRAAVAYPLAVLYALHGEAAKARSCLEWADPVMRELGLGQARAFAPLFTASVDVLTGRPEAAERAYGRARRAAERLGDGGMAAAAGRGLARLLVESGRPQDAARASAGLPAGERLAPLDAADAAGCLARIAAAAGDSGRALALAEDAVAAAAGTDCPAAQGTARLDLAHVLAAAGRPAQAADAARTARADFARKSHHVGGTWADAFLAALERLE
jgi:class 3 adenylate cyclase/tetratricopeptide (TPR) repeat protein